MTKDYRNCRMYFESKCELAIQYNESILPEICKTCSNWEKDMEKKEKPKLCEFLGVEIGEYFDFPDMDVPLFVNYKGELKYIDEEDVEWNATFDMLTCVINYPDLIIHKRRWKKDDIEDAKAIKRIYREYLNSGYDVIIKRKDGFIKLIYKDEELLENIFPKILFPSIKEGEAFYLSTILNG